MTIMKTEKFLPGFSVSGDVNDVIISDICNSNFIELEVSLSQLSLSSDFSDRNYFSCP